VRYDPPNPPIYTVDPGLGLRHFGVECTVVEKHVSTLDFPKGRRVNTRTVEILRQWGLEAAVADVSLPRAESLFVFEGDTLLAADFQRRELPGDEVNPASPTRELICSQERLEPVLRAQAKDRGVDLQFSTEFVGFTQDADGVSADVVADSGRVSVRARYLVAADGGQGRTRDALGIGRSGPGTFGHRLSVLVEANLATRMNQRQSAIYWLRQPLPGSLFIAVDNKTRWLFVVPYEPDAEPGEPLTERRCIDLVRGGLGDDSVELHYLGHRVWQPTALVADRYLSGRVFLAGDAAHLTTPEGGLGMNCGVADAHNLAWKLAGVLAGWASPRLLDSYRAERRPHAVACVEASLGPARPPNPIDGLVLGHVYQSAVITNDRTAPPTTRDPVGDYLPAGRPGHRAPHLLARRRTINAGPVRPRVRRAHRPSRQTKSGCGRRPRPPHPDSARRFGHRRRGVARPLRSRTGRRRARPSRRIRRLAQHRAAYDGIRSRQRNADRRRPPTGPNLTIPRRARR
jgi:putative polyketide hydroxylase